MQKLCVLGSTGSIGCHTLDVIRLNPSQFSVFALTAGKNSQLMFEQCIEFMPEYAVMDCPAAALELNKQLKAHDLPIEVLAGEQAACDVAADAQVDMVMAAIVGAAGLLPTLSAIEASKTVLLANKESLVMSGELFIEKVRKHNATLLPIDSEHNAIFQCLPNSTQCDPQNHHFSHKGVSKILLTGSGGPFLNRPLETFDSVTVAEAVAHPNWSMGQKISVDSATMMNKGLEFIEAKHLFAADCGDIEVVLHPQSIIHSMVQYTDGSVLAQMGRPDMRTPIAHAMAYPERISSGVAPLDFSSITDFTFQRPDFDRYPNLKLAIEACAEGQAATTVLNAANEVAVSAFLNEKIAFTDIFRLNHATLDKLNYSNPFNIEQILELDTRARAFATEYVDRVRSLN